MPYWLFDGTDDQAVSSAAPEIAAPPCALMCLFSVVAYPAANPGTVGGLYDNTTGANNLRIQIAATTGDYAAAQAGSGGNGVAIASPPVPIDRWVVGVGNFYNDNWRTSFYSFKGSRGSESSARSGVAPNRLSICKRESSTGAGFLNARIAWFGAVRGVITIPELEDLLSFRKIHPLDAVGAGRVIHYYQADDAAGFRDWAGGLHLTASGGVAFSPGGVAIPPYRGRSLGWRDSLMVSSAAPGHRVKFTVSVNDTEYSVDVPVESGRRHVIEARRDEANNIIGIKANGGTEVTTSTT